jgi:sulfatase maturation enzyme AslB (radical SAM superfamily)
LSALNVFTLVVTSAVIPIPAEWMKLPRRLRVAVSIDGLPEHHDVRRKPATYERILKNIEGRELNIHWTITRPMLSRAGYMEEYVAFWSGRPEVNRIWLSLFTRRSLANRVRKCLAHRIAKRLRASCRRSPRDIRSC